MSPPALVGLFDGRRRDLSPLHKSAHFLQFALHIVFASAAYLPDNCACFGQISVKSQEIHPVPKRVNVRFVVQGQADRGGGIHLPLMVVFCFRLTPTRSHFPPKRANAPVPVVSVVVVQRAVGIDVADVVGVRRIRRNKMYPKRFTLSHDPAFSTRLTYTSRQAQV